MPVAPFFPVAKKVTHQARAKKVFDIEVAGIRAVKAQLDASFDNAVESVLRSLSNRGKIVVAGIGKSGNVGRKIAATLTSTGSTAVVLDSVDALHGDLGIINDGDVVLCLSYSGESEEMLNLVGGLKRFSVTVISFTGNARSTLARFSDLVLNTKIPKEACPFNLAPTTSTSAMLVLGDALAMAIMEARGFKKSDFARHHPSGSIGRNLLLRVSDIMRSEKRNPVAPQTITVQDAILIMTRAKAGCVSVVNKSGKLSGVFTDGDLRRHLSRDPNALQRTLSELMTRKPIFIREDALAVDLLKTFNERNIDDLIVVNAKREPVGIVDLQDLPKLKLM